MCAESGAFWGAEACRTTITCCVAGAASTLQQVLAHPWAASWHTLGPAAAPALCQQRCVSSEMLTWICRAQAQDGPEGAAEQRVPRLHRQGGVEALHLLYARPPHGCRAYQGPSTCHPTQV